MMVGLVDEGVLVESGIATCHSLFEETGLSSACGVFAVRVRGLEVGIEARASCVLVVQRHMEINMKNKN